MSLADDFRADYRSELEESGEPITITRGADTATALGKVTRYDPEELTPGVIEGQQLVVLLAEDLINAGFPVPPAAGDTITHLGVDLFIEHQPTRRRIGTVDIAYDCVVR